LEILGSEGWKRGIFIMAEIIPEKLFVCICKTNQHHAEIFSRYFDNGVPIPSELQEVRSKHVKYYEDLAAKGILWLAGSWADHTGGMQIFAVGSMDEARKVQREDPFFINGTMYDDMYYEWQIHTPYEKVPANFKEKITQTLKECGMGPKATVG
jgi:uncharacterized protein YciI